VGRALALSVESQGFESSIGSSHVDWKIGTCCFPG